MRRSCWPPGAREASRKLWLTSLLGRLPAWSGPSCRSMPNPWLLLCCYRSVRAALLGSCAEESCKQCNSGYSTCTLYFAMHLTQLRMLLQLQRKDLKVEAGPGNIAAGLSHDDLIKVRPGAFLVHFSHIKSMPFLIPSRPF